MNESTPIMRRKYCAEVPPQIAAAPLQDVEQPDVFGGRMVSEESRGRAVLLGEFDEEPGVRANSLELFPVADDPRVLEQHLQLFVGVGRDAGRFEPVEGVSISGHFCSTTTS